MNSNDFACIYEFLKEEIEKEHLNIEKEHLGQKIFDQVQNRRNFAREEHRDFWTDKFLYDALLPVLVISIITSAIVLTGVGILRKVNENLSLILIVCSFGTHIIIWKIFNSKDFSWIQLQFGKRHIILLRYVGRLQRHCYLDSSKRLYLKLGIKITSTFKFFLYFIG